MRGIRTVGGQKAHHGRTYLVKNYSRVIPTTYPWNENPSGVSCTLYSLFFCFELQAGPTFSLGWDILSCEISLSLSLKQMKTPGNECAVNEQTVATYGTGAENLNFDFHLV